MHIPLALKICVTALFRIILSFSVLVFSCNQALAQATTEPAYANMQRAVGGIIQQTAQARGYLTFFKSFQKEKIAMP